MVDPTGAGFTNPHRLSLWHPAGVGDHGGVERRAPSALPWLALAVLVLVSTAIRAAAAWDFTVPWIAPDEMLYGLVGESLWETGTLTVRGLETPYYSLLYPVVAGLPLALEDTGRAIHLTQALQALAMSLAAVPVYVWGRRFLSARSALAASLLTLAVPSLAYSGLLMTEALYYPLIAVALVTLARTLEEPTAFRQGLMLAAVALTGAVRLQALILLPVLGLAALAHARMTRSWVSVKRLAPLLGGMVAATALVVLARAAFGVGASWQDVLGAYATLGDEQAISAGILEQVVWHVAGLSLITLGLPLLATALLVGRALAHGEDNPRAASFLATVSAYVPLLVLQVAAFAAGHVEHVSERYLLTAAPPLFLGFVLWIQRGAPRPAALLAGCSALFVATLVAVPLDRLAPPRGIQDAFSSTVLVDLADAASTNWARAALIAAGVLAVALIALVPRRAAPALIAVVVAGLIVQAVVATREVERASAAEERKATGSDSPTWVDDARAGRVTLLATDDRPWTADARTFFWNQAIAEVVAVDGAKRPVPPTSFAATFRESDGFLLDAAGAPLAREEVVAPLTMVLDGTKLAEAPAAGSETIGLALWRVSGPIRVALRRSGFLPNGDITAGALVLVPACKPGTLELTLLGKSGAAIDVRANGIPVQRIVPAPGTVVEAAIHTPPDADGSERCLFELDTTNLVGTTRVEFVPDE